ncbi:hypothetical protein [Aeoliella mucimassa]|uniref:Uncharacterized protein n=1 Tax=Aeoliella mucimassa TaxID=2527972 RepID=A0A518ARA2_9BACT|nr:hypothetical protein [Aeoliella mucimassa]QDU57254.1 hypothetical protein Pan181_34690 [Aeoliella mucimassa]
MITGCGHPEISPVAYDYSIALYSITNRELDQQLTEVEARIREAAAQGDLTSTDADALNGVIAKAKTGDWKAANVECRALMEAQIKR